MQHSSRMKMGDDVLSAMISGVKGSAVPLPAANMGDARVSPVVASLAKLSNRYPFRRLTLITSKHIPYVFLTVSLHRPSRLTPASPVGASPPSSVPCSRSAAVAPRPDRRAPRPSPDAPRRPPSLPPITAIIRLSPSNRGRVAAAVATTQRRTRRRRRLRRWRRDVSRRPRHVGQYV